MKYKTLSELSQKAFIEGICVNCYLEGDVKKAVNEFMNFIDDNDFITCKEEIKDKVKETFGDRILND